MRTLGSLLFFVVLFVPSVLAWAGSSFEIESLSEKHHVTADKTFYHSNEKVYEAIGHVVISSEGKRLSADYVRIDTNTRDLVAKGDVILVESESVIQGSEFHYNMNTGLGTIFYGRVSNSQYSLRGQLIRKISSDRFLTTEGEYTTCKDCAESWKIAASNVDFTVEGYAYMENVFIKVKDVPMLYMPYMVIPVKSKRQSGFLFPKLSNGTSTGFNFVQPYFWAIGEHQDATIGLGKFSKLGIRYEFEHRYKWKNDVEGTLNLYHTRDRTFQFGKSRTGITTTHEWPITDHLKTRWRLVEISDRDYVKKFTADIPGISEPALESNVVVNAPFSDFFVSGEVKRYRNLLTDDAVKFDSGMVQATPTVHLGLRDRKLLGPIYGGFYGRYDHFVRGNGAFQDFNANKIYDGPATENLREADRFIMSPEILTPFSVAGVFSIGPSVQYNEMDYRFNLPGTSKDLASTSSRYVQTKVELSTVFDRVWDYNGIKISKIKHQMIPHITFNYIPWIDQDSKHPFQTQIKRQGGQFDQFDLIPVSNSSNFLRFPMGKSINYGFTSRLIQKTRTAQETIKEYPYDLTVTSKKYGKPLNRLQEIKIEQEKIWDQNLPNFSGYTEFWTLTANQAYDFIDALRFTDKTRAFSQLTVDSALTLDRFTNSISWAYYPRLIKPASSNQTESTIFNNNHSVSTKSTYVFANKSNIRGTRSLHRALGMNFTYATQPNPSKTLGAEITWSLNDLFAIYYRHDFDLLRQNGRESLTYSREASATYTSPSECWMLGVNYKRDQQESAFAINFGVNLMGTGYVGINNYSSQGNSSILDSLPGTQKQ